MTSSFKVLPCVNSCISCVKFSYYIAMLIKQLYLGRYRGKPIYSILILKEFIILESIELNILHLKDFYLI